MEGIYFIHTRELLSLKEPIYKLGRSNNLDCRVRNYPKRSNVLFTMKCKNSIKCEQHLIKLFKEKFIQKKDYGTEYFEGDIDEMINEIYNYLYICNTNEKANLTETVTEPLTETVTEPLIETITEPLIETITEPLTETVTELVAEPLTELVTEPLIETITEPLIETITEPLTETVTELVTETVADKDISIIYTNNIICPKCNCNYKYKSVLEKHLRTSVRCISSEEEIKNIFEIIKKNYIKKKKKRIISCNICNNVFTKTSSLKRHQYNKCFKENTFINCNNINDKNDKNNKNNKNDKNHKNDKNIISNIINSVTPELAKDIVNIIIKKNYKNISKYKSKKISTV